MCQNVSSEQRLRAVFRGPDIYKKKAPPAGGVPTGGAYACMLADIICQRLQRRSSGSRQRS